MSGRSARTKERTRDVISRAEQRRGSILGSRFDRSLADRRRRVPRHHRGAATAARADQALSASVRATAVRPPCVHAATARAEGRPRHVSRRRVRCADSRTRSLLSSRVRSAVSDLRLCKVDERVLDVGVREHRAEGETALVLAHVDRERSDDESEAACGQRLLLNVTRRGERRPCAVDLGEPCVAEAEGLTWALLVRDGRVEYHLGGVKSVGGVRAVLREEVIGGHTRVRCGREEVRRCCGRAMVARSGESSRVESTQVKPSGGWSAPARRRAQTCPCAPPRRASLRTGRHTWCPRRRPSRKNGMQTRRARRPRRRSVAASRWRRRR
jgi:hypothetical protein